jgi:N-methylhydantoinase B
MKKALHDPVLLEVMRNELEALLDEMHIAIRKTGRSPMVQIGDLGVTLCDSKGRGFGLGFTKWTHSMMYRLVRRVLHQYGPGLQAGDIFMVNDPYAGASHLPDLVLIAPLFWQGSLAAFAVDYSHQTDMGGRFPGSASGRCTQIYEEGLRIPCVRVVAGGLRNDELITVLMANVRGAEEFIGDVDAKMAGIWRANENLQAILDRYGIEQFDACCDHLNATAAQQMRAAVARVPDGDYSAKVELGDNGLHPVDPPLVMAVTLHFRGDRLTVDFTGTSRQAEGGVNMPVENTIGRVHSTLRELLCPAARINEGTMSAVEVVAPPGSLVNPDFPAPVAGRAPNFFMMDEVLHRALAQVMPELVPVPRLAWDVMHFSQERPDGSEYGLMDLCAGGWGGRPESDGPDGLAGNPSSAIPAELVERQAPLVIEGFGLVQDTEGPGAHRGSLGVFRTYRFLEEGEVMIRTNRIEGSAGLAGGQRGEPSFSTLTTGETELLLDPEHFTHFSAQPGDVFHHQVGGCGGHGDPLRRDPDLLARDLLEERISPARARERYGMKDPDAVESAAGQDT